MKLVFMKYFYLLGVANVRLTSNVALRGNATQSSTRSIAFSAGSPYVASYANDGDFDTGDTCSKTEHGTPTWWQIDLQELYLITKVAITSSDFFGSECLR